MGEGANSRPTALRFACLSGNALKLIAALFMVIDHAGVLFFPGVAIFRILGRLSYPIFAFMIAEGCRYTKHKMRYFLSVFLLGALCQAVYYAYSRSTYLSVLITLSVGILVTYALQFFKGRLFAEKRSALQIALSFLLFAGAVGGAWLLNRVLRIDYGFWGCMRPVFASLMEIPQTASPRWKALDRIPLRVCALGIGLLMLALAWRGWQLYSLLALPLLLLYSGKRGKWRMKSFFYIFYPAHLLLLEGLHMLLSLLS